MLTRYVTEHGWNLAEVYKDDGYTGTNFDRRPAFNEMMEKVRSGEINLVVVKDECVILELNTESPQRCGFCDVSSVF